MAVSSDHALYAPKPTYDQLDHYRSSPKKSGEEKLRRSGLATITPQAGGSSDSEESERGAARPLLRRQRSHHTRCHSDSEVTPLSPPPSLVAEDEDTPQHPRLEDPAPPSTPESGSSTHSTPGFHHEVTRAPSAEEDKEDRKGHVSDDLPPPRQGESGPDHDTSGDDMRGEGDVFPSLPDHYLRSIGLSKDDLPLTDNLTAQEIESKFRQLSLAFKTDRLTLRARLDVQQRQRDTAETNFDTEIHTLRSAVLALHADCLDTELVDAVTQVRRHLDVLTTSTTRLVSASEVWGAVQQEWRVSRALEVLLLHVENVKRLYERDHHELEEMRKLLNEYQIEIPSSSANSTTTTTTDTPVASRRLRALSLAVCGKQQSQESRRISLTTGTTRAALSAFLGGRSSKRRASLMPDMKPFHEMSASVAAVAAAAATGSGRASISLSREKTEEGGQANGVFSITEEGSESGGEGCDTPPSGSPSNTPTAAAISRTLAQLHPELYSAAQPTQEHSRRPSEDDTLSLISQSMAADSTTPSTPMPNTSLRPQHWLMVGLEDLAGWVRGGRWPYSSQQTVRGARYAFTSLLLLLAAFFFILTVSSSEENLPPPYHPGWTTIRHILHPFVTLRYIGVPPT